MPVTPTESPIETMEPSISLNPTAKPTPAPVLGPAVLDCVLVNADTNADIGIIVDGAVYDYDSLPPPINIRAETVGAVGSVMFRIDGVIFNIENFAPYALGGDDESNYFTWVPTKFDVPQTVTATIFPGPDATGSPVDSKSCKFTLALAPPPSPAPVKPTPSPVTPSAAPVPPPTPSPVLGTAAPVKPTPVPVVKPTSVPVKPTPVPVLVTSSPILPSPAPTVKPTAAPAYPTRAPIKAPVSYCVDFETTASGAPLTHGQYVSDQWLTWKLNITASSITGGYTPAGQARIFDTKLPGPDPDLGTPNEFCPGGGPGEGAGGVPTAIGANCKYEGKVLIIQEDNEDPSVPDDSAEGGTIRFDFTYPVTLNKIGFLDLDGGLSALMDIKKADGSHYDLIPLNGLGDNSIQEELFSGKNNVVSLNLGIKESGAVRFLCYTVEDLSHTMQTYNYDS